MAPPPGGTPSLALTVWGGAGPVGYKGSNSYPHMNPTQMTATTTLPTPITTTATVVPPPKVSRLRRELELWWEEDHR